MLQLLDTNSRIISTLLNNRNIKYAENNQTTETLTVKCIVNKYSSCMVQLLKKIKCFRMTREWIHLADISGKGVKYQTKT